MLDKLRAVADRYDKLCFQSEQADFYADPKKAREEIGFEAKKTLEDMCADTWRWQQNNPNGYKA